MQIAIGTQVGYPVGSAGVAGFTYLLNDTFTTDRAAGALNGIAAEPGPGVRDVADTGNNLSASGGSLVTAAIVGGGNPAIRYGAIARAAGQIAIATVRPGAGTVFSCRVGWTSTSSYAGTDAIIFGNSRALTVWANSVVGAAVGLWEDNTDYRGAVIQRAAGGMLLIKGGAFASWTLLWIYTAGTGTPRGAFVGAAGVGASPYAVREIKVPKARWLPTPLVSDGFSAWGSSDGLGHAEGIAGGIGSGGNGKAWTANVGTWSASGGVAAASALSGGVAVATVDSGKADGIVTAKLTRSAGTAGIVLRWVDANNHVQARHTGTNAQLVKVVAGTPTTLVDAAATYVAGAEIRLVVEGQTFRLFYNNASVGTEQTIADAALASATLVGLRSTDTANTFDDFTCYARGSGGEYSALDAY